MARRLTILCLALAGLYSPLIAQQDPEGEFVIGRSAAPETSEEFGSGITIHNVAPAAFNPTSGQWDACRMLVSSQWVPTPPSATCFLGANFELPAGSLLVSAVIYYYDANAGENPLLSFSSTSTTGQVSEIVSATFPDIASGNNSVTVNFPPGTTIDNLNNVYGIEVVLEPNTRFYRARVRYQRQVSPAPGVATFPNDVPTTHPFFRFVEALAASNITAGCLPDSFCPDMPVTRGQMAVFLAAALGLHFPN
jgi:hypothetical protein